MKRVIVTPKVTSKVLLKEGEYIEEKVRRVTLNNEPIEDSAPIIYTERKDGVIPAYNIRTDRWDIALEAMNTVSMSKDKIIASQMAKSQNQPAEKKSETAGAEPSQQ